MLYLPAARALRDSASSAVFGGDRSDQFTQHPADAAAALPLFAYHPSFRASYFTADLPDHRHAASETSSRARKAKRNSRSWPKPLDQWSYSGAI